ncbi:hypothetical protein CIB84_008232, partial [Bambusicola thoracicus]
ASIKILEDQLDELIVETATKRKQWPKKILVHAIQTMKAEQEMLVNGLMIGALLYDFGGKKTSESLGVEDRDIWTMKLYQPVVTPEEIKSQPSQDAYVADLKQATEMASEQIGEAMKYVEDVLEALLMECSVVRRQVQLDG